MKKLVIIVISTAAMISLGLVQANGYSGEFSIGAQYVMPSDAKDDGSGCDGFGTEFCGNVWGLNSQVSLLKTLDNGILLYGDVTLDRHDETDSNTSSRDLDAVYVGYGIHAIMNAKEANPWGVFLIHTRSSNKNNADPDNTGAITGLGIEKSWGDVFAQTGHMKMTDDRGDTADGMDNLTFIKVGTERKLNSGELNFGFTHGRGDFDYTDDDKGIWTQMALTYEAALPKKGMNWYTGLQSDYVKVSGGQDEKATFNSVKLGIKIPFGEKESSPFETPNFRAPITNAGEMN